MMYRSMLSFDQTTRSSFNAHPLVLAHLLRKFPIFFQNCSQAANAESIRSNYSRTYAPSLAMKLKAQLASYSERCMLHVHSIPPGRAIKPHSSCSKNIMPWQAGLNPVPLCCRRKCHFLQRKPALGWLALRTTQAFQRLFMTLYKVFSMPAFESRSGIHLRRAITGQVMRIKCMILYDAVSVCPCPVQTHQ